LSGLAYFSTSSQRSLPSIGNTNIVHTVTTIHIIAYLIVFTAGFILSSFPPERIKSNHHRSIKTIENIHATSTNIAIQVSIKSHAFTIFSEKIPQFQLCPKAALASFINIIGKVRKVIFRFINQVLLD
jgi:hypothetical protein